MKNFSPFRYSLFIQTLVCLSGVLIAFVESAESARAFFWGALIFIGPNLYFTHYAFRYGGKGQGEWIYRSFMWGQTSKLWLSALGFALLFRFAQPTNVAAVFTGYVVMIMTQWWLARKIAILAAASSPGTDSDRGEKNAKSVNTDAH